MRKTSLTIPAAFTAGFGLYQYHRFYAHANGIKNIEWRENSV